MNAVAVVIVICAVVITVRIAMIVKWHAFLQRVIEVRLHRRYLDERKCLTLRVHCCCGFVCEYGKFCLL